ncbi:HECT E3 ubiquitin ligase [Phytophthora cinnamomi]|uniref:HECT E3 ubiquitin ligase n=1 Tax=Phytophthora cinnamomi TaxID=4785 RepID=UPI003559C269|nr:HECT E3 ubiquitin ligase [Phytophthora cinnamomi]
MVQRFGAAPSLLPGINESSTSLDGSAGHVSMGDLSAHQRQTIEFYMYVFLGVVMALAGGSMLLYCVHQRRLERFEHDDNLNNNMQRHLLEDSVVQDGQAEWQCSVCYHENHPAKRECLMCGTPEVISQGVAATTTKQARKSFQLLTTETPESQAALAARNRSFHVRRLNEMNLNQRQRGARRRHLWQRERTPDGQFRWVRVGHCQPSRLSHLAANIRASLPAAAVSLLPSTPEAERLSAPAAYAYSPEQESPLSIAMDNHSNREGLGVETELTMVESADADGKYSAAIRKNACGCRSPTALSASAISSDDALIAQPSVGYVRHVNEQGQAEWVPADTLVHEHDTVTSIDLDEFPRATSYIDFESIAALPFKLKVRWFFKELGKIAVPWDEGHLLLKIRREAVLGESMHLLMLVPAADLRQRLRIEFIDEPGLDAGGLLREWVLLLCEQLFDESYGLFQRTHADQSGYWLNPNSREIHRDHLHCFQFVGRLLAKCLLEGQLMTVHLALPLLKHLLGVPISFSDLEFLDAELHRHALWLRDNDGAEALELDFTIQRQTSDGTVVTDELKPGGKDIPVTDANKEEYLTLLLKHKMFAGVGEQLAALLQGLYDVLPRSLLAVFDYQELELLLCGVPSIDVADWESHTDVRYVRAEQGFNSPTSSEQQVVQWFWEAVRVFSQEERARLLQFVTGTSRVPAEGFRALLSHDGRIRRFGLQLVSIGAPPTGLYPKAHTCFNRLDLPVYRSYEELVTYLTLVINMEITGFTMQ